MSSVAEWNLARVLAAAKEHRCGLRRFKFVRGEASPRMRSIAQRLLGALAAATPEVGLSCLDFYPKRCLLGDLWCFLHQISTLYLVVHPTDNYVSASPQAPIRFVAAPCSMPDTTSERRLAAGRLRARRYVIISWMHHYSSLRKGSGCQARPAKRRSGISQRTIFSHAVRYHARFGRIAGFD